MPIEVTLMPGKGGLQITGQVGEVMQESAQAAMSYPQDRAPSSWQSDYDRFDKTDTHIHIPEGAIPKDGPSAGISLATALISAFTGRKVHNEVGMTGEITLRGRVLPVGGVKEKVLAAHRAGTEEDHPAAQERQRPGGCAQERPARHAVHFCRPHGRGAGRSAVPGGGQTQLEEQAPAADTAAAVVRAGCQA